MRNFQCWLVVYLWCLTGWAGAQTKSIEWETRRLSDKFYAEGATIGDFNRDGKPDFAVGPFWYEGPEFEKSHQLYHQEPFDPHNYSNNFLTYTDDINDDGWDDIVVAGWPGKDASWFENPKGAKRYWPKHVMIDVCENESPAFTDLDGDEIKDMVCSADGYFGFAQRDPENPTAKWKFRRISDQTAGGKYTHGLGVADVDGDGRKDLLEKSGWWQQPESLEGDPVWKKHPYPFGEGHGPSQMFTYDVDADGDNDVICSRSAHGYGLAWFEHKKEDGKITFETHQFMGSKPADNAHGVCFSQLHALDLLDVNGDGLKDIVTGKRYWAHGPKGDAEPNAPAVLYWFELQRNDAKIEWVPHLIDDDSGVGTDFAAGDLNGDGVPDMVIGNKKGTSISLSKIVNKVGVAPKRLQPRRVELKAQPASVGLPSNDGLAPKAAAAAMTLPDGFNVELAAGEPMIHQPVAMAWDHRGRLWVAEAYTYPQRAPEGEGRDKIIILEDIDLDGLFDKRTVFAEGLNLVSGLEVGFSGVWVGAAPYLLFIPDSDGDDTPDSEPIKLLDGFGYEDTHETLNSFIWGPDGWLYGCHGIFTHSRIGKPGTPDDQRIPMNAAVWRYHPVRHEFEVFAEGSSNPWGVDFNDYGHAFITACVIPHMYHVIQGARYQRQAGQHFSPYVFDDIKTIADHRHYSGELGDHAWWGRDEPVDHRATLAAGGGQAHAGAMIYLGNNWPRQFRNSIFMSNIHGNRINNDWLRRVGSGYVASHGDDLLYANDRWFRAINLKYGPDGTVYVIDWYDKNACHRTTPQIWDRTNGRVYRVSFGQQSNYRIDLSNLSENELVELQLHENEWYVRMARRVLQERSFDSAGNAKRSAGETLPIKQRLEQIALTHANVTRRLRAVWTLQACGLLDDELQELLIESTDHKSEYLRAWLIQLDLEDHQPSDLAKLVEMAGSDNSQVVRQYLASAMQRLETSQRWEIAEQLVRHPDDADDHNLPFMNWYGIEPLVVADPDRAMKLAESSRIPLVSQYIYRRAAADSNARDALLLAMESTQDAHQRKTMLREVAAAFSSRGKAKMPERWPNVYALLSKSEDEEVLELARRITVKFGDASVFPALRQIANDEGSPLASRRVALSTLIEGKDPEADEFLLTLLNVPGLRPDAIRGLAAYANPKTPDAILNVYDSLDAQEKPLAIATLTSRASYASRLLDAIESKQIPSREISAIAIRQLATFDDDLVRRVNQVWGTLRSTPEEKLAKIESLKRQLGADQLAKADLRRGRVLFDNVCGKCHQLFDSGGDIGPNLTGSDRANIDYLLHNSVDPSAVVGKDYQMTMITTSDGRSVSGLLREENESSVVLQSAEERLVINKSEIDERELSTVSMMPEGQLDQLNLIQIRDLLAYVGSSHQAPRLDDPPTFDKSGKVIPGAIEGERLKIKSVSSGGTHIQPTSEYKDRWSRSLHLWWIAEKENQTLTLEFESTTAGTYEIFAGMTRAVDYGIVEFSVNDNRIAKQFDLFDMDRVSATGPQSLGQHALKAGTNQLTVHMVGANEAAIKKYMFGLDYIYLRHPK